MAESARPKFAVCPRIELNGTSWKPKLFRSQSAARRFLNSEIPSSPLEIEAQSTGLTIKEARARRAERKAQLRNDRAEEARRIKAGELAPLASRPDLQVHRNSNQGWEEPVPVRCFSEYSGLKCARTLREFFPSDSVPGVSKRNRTEEILATGNSETDYTCCLDKDWHFEEIDAAAWRYHERSRGAHQQLSEFVIEAVHDLETAFQKWYPDATCGAVADFWRSWQVQRHIEDFSARLVRMLAGDVSDASAQADRARVHVYRQLAAFAYEIQVAAGDPGSPVPASPVGPRKRGHPQVIPDERKEAALRCKKSGGSNRDAAKLIYDTPYPKLQQTKNVPAILKNYLQKLKRSASPDTPRTASPKPRKNRG